MKIAIFHDLPSGGGKRALFEQARRLAEHHDLDVYSLSTADHTFCDLRPFVKSYHIYPFEPSKLFSRPFGRLNQIQRYRDLLHLKRLSLSIANDIDVGKYDLLFVHPCIWTQAPLLLLYSKTPSVYYCHEPNRAIYEPSNSSSSERNWMRSLLNRADLAIRLYRSTLTKLDLVATRSAGLVLANSQFNRGNIANIYGINPVVNYLGVDTGIFQPPMGDVQRTYILSVGAVQSTKGFDDVIDLVGQIPSAQRPPLHIVGNSEIPSERKRLLSLARQKCVDIEIEIGVCVDTLIERYHRAIFMLYLPHNEPFGLVVLEAMACGVPVVGVSEGGLVETIIDGETGFLIPRGGDRAVSRTKTMLEDHRIRENMARKASEIARCQWGWDTSVRELDAILQDFNPRNLE